MLLPTTHGKVVQIVEGISRKSLLRPGALALLSAAPFAQAASSAPAEPALARTPDGPQERHFMSDATLHVSLPVPAERRELEPGWTSAWSGRWSLAAEAERHEGEFESRGGALVAAIELEGLAPHAREWTFTAEWSWKGAPRGSWSAAITIELLPPVAGLALDLAAGEAPLRVRFEDRSRGLVTARRWELGDGTLAQEATVEHLYRTPGRHPVALTVSNPAGSSRFELPEPIVVAEQDLLLHYGMNLSENVWWQRGIAFADAMARAGEFYRVVNGSIGRVPAPLIPLSDAQEHGSGWPDLLALGPGEKAGARLFGNLAGSLPDGRTQPYVLTWQGTGSCRLVGAGVVREEQRGPQRVEVFVDPTAGNGNALLVWQLDESSPLDPVRDAHVWLPGTEAEQPVFWPPFLEKLQALNGGRGPVSVRTMDWSQVNQYGRTDGSAPFVFDLAGRITPASPSQGTKRGVAVEYQALLASTLGADLHFNVPHRTDALSPEEYDTFLRDVFTRIRDGAAAVPGVNGGRPFPPLAPGRKLVLEYSNEIWNALFPVNAWLKAEARATGRSVAQQAASEIRHVFGVAEEVFAGEHRARLETFVGGFLANPSFLLEVLAELGPTVQVDAAGPALYFGPRREDVDAWMLDAEPGSCPNCPTPEDVLESGRLRIGDLDLRLLEHQLVVAAHGNPDGSTTRLELYEAGASFAAGFQPWGVAATAAQRLPAMYDA